MSELASQPFVKLVPVRFTIDVQFGMIEVVRQLLASKMTEEVPLVLPVHREKLAQLVRVLNWFLSLLSQHRRFAPVLAQILLDLSGQNLMATRNMPKLCPFCDNFKLCSSLLIEIFIDFFTFFESLCHLAILRVPFSFSANLFDHVCF